MYYYVPRQGRFGMTPMEADRMLHPEKYDKPALFDLVSEEQLPWISGAVALVALGSIALLIRRSRKRRRK